jgi:ABC-2 type transport system ATP-binding protein
VLTTHYLEEAEELCGRIAMLQKGQIVALDTTANLLKQFSGLQLVMRLDGALPESLKPMLTQGSGTAGGERLRLRLSNYDQTADVLATVRAAGLRIDELEVQRADLEDVFLQIMHGQNNTNTTGA